MAGISAGDGMCDGRFVIKSGQGISQAIADELGLTGSECKTLVKKSIWNKIFTVAATSGNLESDSAKFTGKEGAWQNNFKVGDAFKFTQAAWKEIVKLVNDALNKDIEIQEESVKFNTPKTTVPANVGDQQSVQTQFDDANQLLTDIANGKTGSEITPFNDGESKYYDLPDGRWVTVVYCDDGTIRLAISTSAGQDAVQSGGGTFDGSEVEYTIKDGKVTKGYYRRYTDKTDYAGKITDGMDSDAIIELMEEIFGKCYPIPKTTVPANVENSSAAQEQFDAANKLLSNVANGLIDISDRSDEISGDLQYKTVKLSDGTNIRAAYDNSDKSLTLYIPQKDGTTVYYKIKNDKIEGHTVNKDGSGVDITENIDKEQIINLVEAIFGKHAFTPKTTVPEGVDSRDQVQKKFDSANALLADAAIQSNLDIKDGEYNSVNEHFKYKIATLQTGQQIMVKRDDNGNIKVYVSYDTAPDHTDAKGKSYDGYEVMYSIENGSITGHYDWDNNGVYTYNIKTGMDQNGIMALAKEIFGEEFFQ